MIVDFLGNEIKVGSEIVYPVTEGRSAVLVHALVVETRPEHFVPRDARSYDRKACLVVDPLKRLYGTYKTKKKIPLLFPERCLVVKS